MASLNSAIILAFLKSEFSRLAPSEGSRLLDLGCGTCPYRDLYHKRFEHIILADFNQRSARLDVLADAQLLPFPDETFDAVLFSEVIEHLPEPSRALREISRVVKPGGILLITWPLHYMLHETPSDFIRYTEFGMKNLLDRNGFSIELLVRRGRLFSLCWSVFEFLIQGVIEILARQPIVGGIGKALKKVIDSTLFGPVSTARAKSLMGRSHQFGEINTELRLGNKGHLSLWTLGYCVRARKRPSQ